MKIETLTQAKQVARQIAESKKALRAYTATLGDDELLELFQVEAAVTPTSVPQKVVRPAQPVQIKGMPESFAERIIAILAAHPSTPLSTQDILKHYKSLGWDCLDSEDKLKHQVFAALSYLLNRKQRITRNEADKKYSLKT